MQGPQKDHYSLLNVAPDAPIILIKKAYKRLALRYHPDKNSEDSNAQLNFLILQDAYDTLVNLESREQYDWLRDTWGTIPSEFLPPATRTRSPGPESKRESRNDEIKEAFRKARLREQLEAARLRAEKERQDKEEEEQRIEQEKLQALAAERIRAAREAIQEERRQEEEERKQARDQERLHRVASERIRNYRDYAAREDAKRKAEETREKFEAESRRAEQRRQEEELAERLRRFGMKTPKGIAPNNWSEAELDCLVQWKRDGKTWAVISQNMNQMFDNSRSAVSCRKKYVKLERVGEI